MTWNITNDNHTKTAWIGGLPQNVEEEDVKRIVENSGDSRMPAIISCNVRSNERGTFAFVEFAEERGVEAIISALNNTFYEDQRIAVRYDNRRDARSSKPWKGKGKGRPFQSKGKGKGGACQGSKNDRLELRSRSRSREQRWRPDDPRKGKKGRDHIDAYYDTTYGHPQPILRTLPSPFWRDTRPIGPFKEIHHDRNEVVINNIHPHIRISDLNDATLKFVKHECILDAEIYRDDHNTKDSAWLRLDCHDASKHLCDGLRSRGFDAYMR